jgi:Fe2+ or Zn2+ uptake regulation protein
MNEKLNKMATDICSSHRFKPSSTSFQVYGTCEKCQK